MLAHEDAIVVPQHSSAVEHARQNVAHICTHTEKQLKRTSVQSISALVISHHDEN